MGQAFRLYAKMRSADIVFSLSPVFLWNLSPEHFVKICCISDLNCWSSEFFGPWSERVAAASRRRIVPEADAVFIGTHNVIYCCFAFGHSCISCLMETPPPPNGFSLIQQRSKAALLEVACIISLALRPSHKTPNPSPRSFSLPHQPRGAPG